jgi:glycosyltransferase involved in cell wall biosynthesis
VYGEEKWQLFRKADVFVLPTFSENFGIAIAEALASGTPVITTKGTPWTDLVKYNCGWHTEIGTLPTVNALKEFLQLDEMTLESMGRNGRRLIEEKYSTQSMADEMMKLYKMVKE